MAGRRAFAPRALRFAAAFGGVFVLVGLASAGPPSDRPLEVTVERLGDGTPGPYDLGGQPVLLGTEQVVVDGRSLSREGGYEIDGQAATITFARPVPKGALIWVRYIVVPVALEPTYRLRLLVAPGADPVSAGGSAPVPERPDRFEHLGDELAELSVTGTKTFGINLGSGGSVSVEQALRLAISGKLAPQVEVTAVLSDQNLPIQPEGNTLALKELDKVLIAIRSPFAELALGDYELALDEGEFVRFDRKLEGAKTRIEVGDAAIVLARGGSGGIFRTQFLHPIDGNQGPYQLTGIDGRTDIVVLGGTEKVWINGDRLVRGETNDYVIDYGLAQITFTRARLVTEDDRIVVDFEYIEEGLKVRTTAGRATWTLGDRLGRLGLTWVREDHALASPPADDEAAPVTRVPPRNQLGGLDLTLRLPGSVELAAEFAQGGVGEGPRASKLRLAAEPGLTRDLALEFHGEVRDVAEGFEPLSRTLDAEDSRRWGLRFDADRGAERTGDLALGVRLRDRVLARGFWGTFDTPGAEGARRFGVEGDLPSARSIQTHYFVERIERNIPAPERGSTELTVGRERVEATRPLRGGMSGLMLSRERQETPGGSGSEYVQSRFRLNLAERGPIAGSAALELRRDRRLGAAERDSAFAWTTTLGLKLPRWRAFSFDSQYTHRQKRFSGASESVRTSDLAELIMRGTPWDGLLRADLRYRIAQSHADRKIREFEFVGDGRGFYRREVRDGVEEFIPDARGSYRLRLHGTGDFEPVVEAFAGLKLRLTPRDRLLGRDIAAAWWDHLAAETVLEVSEKTRERNRAAVYRLDQSVFRRPGVTVDGGLRLRQDIFYADRTRRLDARLRVRENRRLRSDISRGERTTEAERSVRLRLAVARRTDLEMSLGRERRLRERGLGLDFDIAGLTAQGALLHRAGRALEVGLVGRWVRDTDRARRPRALAGRAFEVEPMLLYSWSRRGRARVEFTWAHARITGGHGTPVFQMLRGALPGTNLDWRLALDLRLSRFLSGTLAVDGRKRPDLDIEHTGRAEMRTSL